MKKSKKRHLPIFSYIFFALLLIGIAVYVAASLSTDFANFWTRYPGSAVRALLAFATNIFPFSVAEIAIMLLPIAAVTVIVLICKGKFDRIKRPTAFILSLISCISLFFSLFALGFGTGYHTSPLDERLGIEKLKVVYSKELPVKPPQDGKRVTASIAFVPSAAGLLIASEVVRDIIGWNSRT